jgi:transcriptional regulator with XRE-family HTH domain
MSSARSTVGIFFPLSQSHQVAGSTRARLAAFACVSSAPVRHAFNASGAVIIARVLISYCEQSVQPKTFTTANNHTYPPEIALLAMAKNFGEEVNEQLRKLARSVVEVHFKGTQSSFASAIGVTPGFVSDFLAGKRGAGLELLRGVGKFRPIETLRILDISPRIVASLSLEQTTGEGDMGDLPNELKRAARAAIELFGCTPHVAVKAAETAFRKYGEHPEADPDWWLGKMRGHIEEYRKSGERPSVKAKIRNG